MEMIKYSSTSNLDRHYSDYDGFYKLRDTSW